MDLILCFMEVVYSELSVLCTGVYSKWRVYNIHRVCGMC